MEEKITDDEQLAQMLADAFAALPARSPLREPEPEPPRQPQQPQQPRSRPVSRRRRNSLRRGAILLAGLICFALLVALASLFWGYLAFKIQSDIPDSTALPLVAFLGALFLAAWLVTRLSRGGTVFPACGLALLVNIGAYALSLWQDEMFKPQLGGILLKLLLSLAVAMAGFIIGKLAFISGQARQ